MKTFFIFLIGYAGMLAMGVINPCYASVSITIDSAKSAAWNIVNDIDAQGMFDNRENRICYNLAKIQNHLTDIKSGLANDVYNPKIEKARVDGNVRIFEDKLEHHQLNLAASEPVCGINMAGFLTQSGTMKSDVPTILTKGDFATLRNRVLQIYNDLDGIKTALEN